MLIISGGAEESANIIRIYFGNAPEMVLGNPTPTLVARTIAFQEVSTQV
jgi:hypothetical protein